MPTPFGNPLSSDEIALKFYRLILPAEGPYAAAIKQRKGKFKPTEFFSTIEDLWAAIKNADRDGYEVYHACASFKEPHNDPLGTPSGQKQFGRSQRNARGAQSFWLDPDAGPGKPYRDRDVALDALAEFCRAFNLPPPIVVSSGWGLHVYWPLQEMLDRETWQHYARGLKNLCQQYGLKVDHSRTTDISSVLRTPGTHNRKGDVPRAVECDSKFLEIEPYPIGQFELFAAHAGDPHPAKNANIFRFHLTEFPNISANALGGGSPTYSGRCPPIRRRVDGLLPTSARRCARCAIKKAAFVSHSGMLALVCWRSARMAANWATRGRVGSRGIPRARHKICLIA
jgi:hypothetical protein